MTEIRGTPQNTQIREAFVKKATPPVDDIQQAESFIRTLAAKTGGADQDDIIASKKIIQTLSQSAERYMFNAAVLAGQEDMTARELESRVEKIESDIKKVTDITDQLKKLVGKNIA